MKQEVWSEQSNTNTFTIVTIIPAPVITKPGNGNTTSSLPVIEGTAEANSTVTIILNSTPVGSTTSDANGHWTYTPTTPLPDGPYELTATATDAEGNVSPPSSPVHFSVDTRDRAFLGDGAGCAASGGAPSALAMMGPAVLSALRARRLRR
ncbi:Ig-like domain-containing protein [Cystobacter fuscus]